MRLILLMIDCRSGFMPRCLARLPDYRGVKPLLQFPEMSHKRGEHGIRPAANFYPDAAAF
jgi:hypothetical protein